MSIPSQALVLFRDLITRGAQRAAEALGDFSGDTLTVSGATSQIIPLEDVLLHCKTPEEVVFGVNFTITGDVQGFILSLFRWHDVNVLLEALLGQEGHNETLQDLELSLVGEAGNILVSAFLIELEALCDLVITPSPPAVAMEMSCAILSSAVAPLIEADGELLIVEAIISPMGKGESLPATCNILFLPYPSEWPRLYQKLQQHPDLVLSGGTS